MSILEKLNRFFGLYVELLKSCWRLKTWLPFIIYAVLQLLVLYLLAHYINPYIYPVLSPMVSLVGELQERLFWHYPGLYLMLPSVHQWFRLGIGIIFEGLAIGVTCVIFLKLFKSDKKHSWTISMAFRKWPQLFVTWLIISGLLVIINVYVPSAFSGYLIGSPRRIMVFDIAMRLCTVVTYSLFIYTVPAIIVRKNDIGQAFVTSLKYFIRYPIFTFFLAFIPYLLSVPLSYITNRTDIIIDKFSPELVFYILSGGIIMDTIVNYILTGTVVIFLLGERK